MGAMPTPIRVAAGPDVQGPALKSLLIDAGIPAALAKTLRRAGMAFDARPFRASTPSFKTFESDELGSNNPSSCHSGAFPAFSITGGACALNCKHCRANILKPMIPTGDPANFEAMLRKMIANQGLRGFLLSGGSNLRNEVPFDRYLPVIRQVKNDHPALEILAHTALVDARRAKALKMAGVDVAMLDIIGAEETIRDVYHLDRKVADFEASLANLVEAELTVVPHIVLGLHFGRLVGENCALEMIARHKTAAAILVVLMPALADPGFGVVDPLEAGAFFAKARRTLADRHLLLGCARPQGKARVILDLCAVLAGFDGIAYPADEAIVAARMLGRVQEHRHSCCGTHACRRAA